MVRYTCHSIGVVTDKSDLLLLENNQAYVLLDLFPRERHLKSGEAVSVPESQTSQG